MRTEADTEALIQALLDGTIDVIATDHAPHTAADKQCDFAAAAFGISGLETAFGVLMKLVHSGKIDIATLLSKLTSGPAEIVTGKTAQHPARAKAPLELLGTLAVGAPGDITISNPEEEWVVRPRDFASKGKTSPWAGCLLKGRVVVTIVSGKVVFAGRDAWAHGRAPIGK